MGDLEAQIRRALLRFASGEIKLAAFQDWFVGVFWQMEPTSPVRRFSNRIQGILAESSAANWPEDELKATLQCLAEEPVGRLYSVSVTIGGTQRDEEPQAQSSATYVPSPQSLVSIQPADIRREAEFALR